MIFATWNINGLRARFDLVSHWLDKRKPDVVALQETKTEDSSFPVAQFEALGYHCYPHGERAWNGVALLARREMEVLTIGLPGEADVGARLITAKIDDFTMTSVYCPNGKNPEHQDFASKLTWFDSLGRYWQELTQDYEISVIGGDFNIVPSARDSWRGQEGNGQMFHTVEEREKLSAFVSLGLHDLFRELNAGIREFTWWDYRGGSWEKGEGLRIDMIYATPKARALAERVIIDKEYRDRIEDLTPSDHVPVYVELKTS